MSRKYYATPAKSYSKGKNIAWGVAVVIITVIAAISSYPQGYNKFANFVQDKIRIPLPTVTETPYKLGLDLQGGTQLTYRADTEKAQGIDPAESMQGVRDVIERRVNALGVSEPIVQVTTEGSEHRLIVELAGIKDVKEAIKKIGETPLLEFKKENPTPNRELTAEEKKQLADYNAGQEKIAADLLAQALKDPSKFADLAREKSDDAVAIKNEGGSLGVIEKTGAYAKIYSAVTGLAVNAVLPKTVVEDNGISIVKLNEKTSVKEVTANHILICFSGADRCAEDKQITKEEALAKISELKEQATAANFIQLAKDNSTEPGANTTGGDLGSFKPGMMVKEFDEVVFSMATGTISEPVLTQFGYHLIYKKTETSLPAYNVSRIFVKKMVSTDIVTPEQYISSGLNGSQLERATVQFQGQTNEPVIALEFNKEGSELFATLTRENLNKTIAIYLDGTILSAPRVQSEIVDGNAIITGRFTIEEAKVLARRLNSGALPVPIELISQQTVGPTLGAESLNQSIKAGFLAMILVALFMLLLYRIPGLIASLALLIYGVFILALFKLIGVTLTLSGIAGLILSIGMAVDVNVLIFARFKEEIAAGRPYASAMDEAFKRAWPSIRDGHISTLLTAIILMQFSTSFIKGFAVTLSVGVILSLFTAMVIVRLMLGFISRRAIVEKFPFLFLNKKK